MSSLVWKNSTPDRQNFNARLDGSHLNYTLPISSKMPHVLQSRIEPIVSYPTSVSTPTDYRGIENAKTLDRIAVRRADKLILVHLRDVFWIQSKGNLLCLHLQDADYDCRITMKELSMKLDPNCFLRVHRNAIVNLDCVVEFDLPRYGNAFVYLRNGKSLPISRAGRLALRRSLLSRSCFDGDDDNVGGLHVGIGR